MRKCPRIVTGPGRVSSQDTGASNHLANVPPPGSPCQASGTSLGPAQVSGLEEPLMMLRETF